MSQPTPNTGPDATQQTDTTGKPDDVNDDDVQETPEEKTARLEKENADLKANSRKWEDRAKKNKEKADEFDKLQASTASDGEKLAAALKGKDEAETKLARYEVAARTGLPADLAEMLTGSDEDAMEEQAKKLIARLAPTEPKRQAPKPDRSQGGGKEETKVSAADEGRAEAQRRIAARQKKS